MDRPVTSNEADKTHTFRNCRLRIVRGDDEQDGGPCVVEVGEGRSCLVVLRCGTGQALPSFDVSKDREHCCTGQLRYLVDLPEYDCSVVLRFSQHQDQVRFRDLLNKASGRLKKKSVFNERTEKASAAQYFQFYGYLSQQQNMMQDYIRTSTYQRAMLQNTVDFQDKVVIDVGAGSGILSFFAVQAGARKVYAIEASSMAIHAQALVDSNGLSNKITVVPGKVEEVVIPEKADMIISEPMGYMLFNERMLESYVHAKKWLKPGGKMFPTKGKLYVAPFFDDALYMEHYSKANFWYQTQFYGVDLSHLRQSAVDEYFKQPIVDTFDVRHLMAKPVMHSVDFLSAAEEDLHRIKVPLMYTIATAGNLHGLAFWFDVLFDGSSSPVWLSTAPHEPLTHWYQVRCLLQTPILVKEGQTVRGTVILVANQRQSYDVDIKLEIEGTGIKSWNNLDLKNPYFRYTGTQPSPPPGSSTASPTELYFMGASNDAGGPAVGVVGGNHIGGGGMLNSVGGLGLGTMYGHTGIEGSPYTVGDMVSGLPIVSSIPNASMLGGGNAHYVTNRYIVGTQSAVIPAYSGGGGCGDGMAGYTSPSQQRLHAMQYSR